VAGIQTLKRASTQNTKIEEPQKRRRKRKEKRNEKKNFLTEKSTTKRLEVVTEMTLFNTQIGNGEFRLQFETDDKNKFLYMQEKARRCVDNKIESDQPVHAHWVRMHVSEIEDAFVCSRCQRVTTFHKNAPFEIVLEECPYCHCGAKMDEEI